MCVKNHLIATNQKNNIDKKRPCLLGDLLQVGTLAERFEKRCRDEKLNKPNACRPSIDLDEGIMIAMPVTSMCMRAYVLYVCVWISE